MSLGRREFVTTTVGAAAYALFAPIDQVQGGSKMYGLIGKAVAAEGKRDELIKILLEGIANMPGCLSYIVAQDPRDENALWITEVWRSQADHQASLKLPGVQAAIAKGRPLIASFGDRVETVPVGGVGLPK